MKRILSIIIKEIIALLVAIFIVMAIGLIYNGESVDQHPSLKKFEIKLSD